MEFRISNTFQSSLNKLSAQEQKAVKTSAFDLQIGLSGNSTKFHKISRSKDPNFWSVRANNDIRIIVHKTAASILLCYVDHHDDAYKWAERRKIENHPITGAAQIVQVRELVEDENISVPKFSTIIEEKNQTLPSIFKEIKKEQLLSIGVPEEWLDDVLIANEESFLNVAEYLPQEAAEILLEVASGNISFIQAVQQSKNILAQQSKQFQNKGFEHADAQRRFRIIEDIDELAIAMEYPWEKWTVFLHPSQRFFSNQSYNGPASIAGSAGTGKTVVAIHRAVALHYKYPLNKILLTTFSKALANAMNIKLQRLAGKNSSALDKIDVLHMEGVACELMQKKGNQPNIVSDSQLQYFFKDACEKLEISQFETGFLMAEWEHVVDSWQIKSWESYRDVKRLGRKTRIGGPQREKLWSLFDFVWKIITTKELTTWSSVFNDLSKIASTELKYDNIIIDEAQDISVAELKFLANIGGNKPDGLFFAGDLGQRIFRQVFSWKSLGVDVRGRSNILKVNYRTSHQIRQKADKLLPKEISDFDENEESRKGTISIFNSMPPEICVVENLKEESLRISDWINQQIKSGILASEIGIFVRSKKELKRAENAIIKSGQNAFRITSKFEENKTAVNYGLMHIAKGLEFKSVVVMACDENILPQQERLERVTDSSDLEEIYNTERQLLYVACTRARESLLVTAIKPGSEFLEDFKN